MSFIAPKIKKPPPPPKPPQIDDAAREAEMRDQARRRQGRAATLIGGLADDGSGVQGQGGRLLGS